MCVWVYKTHYHRSYLVMKLHDGHHPLETTSSFLIKTIRFALDMHVKGCMQHLLRKSNGHQLGCLFAFINTFQARGLAVLILRQKIINQSLKEFYSSDWKLKHS